MPRTPSPSLVLRLRSAWAGLPGNLRGGLLIFLAAAIVALVGAAVKEAGREMPTLMVVFFRSLFGMCLMLPFLARRGVGSLRTRRPVTHVARIATGSLALFGGFYALTHLPLATAVAISFTKPLFMIFLAVLFLAERVRWRRWAATAAGFAGVLIIVRPGASGVDPAALVALGAALCVAASMVLIKKLSATEHPATMLIWLGIGTTLVTLPPALLVWETPSLYGIGLGLLIAVLTTIIQYLFIEAYKVGEATAITPLDYAQLPVAGLLGYLLFAEIPDLWTWVGAAVVIGSNLYILHRAAKLRAVGAAARTEADA
ncbi:MAG: DMT family transporter [Alphaproteobacteria bacterium]|nr:DMT family transporter [Alphaproteobacteria bacterium]